MVSGELSPHVLGDVVELRQENKIQNQSRSAACRISCSVQDQEECRMAEAEHHRHEAPVQRAGCPEKILGFSDNDHPHGQQEEEIHGDEDDEHAVPMLVDPVVLEGNGGIGPEQHAAVRASGGNERQVFFQREKADEGEEEDGCRPAEEDGAGKDSDHDPPGPDTLDQLRIILVRMQPFQQCGDERGDHENAEDSAQGRQDRWCDMRPHQCPTSLNASQARW